MISKEYLEQELCRTYDEYYAQQKKLKKAEHDRFRYARRIRLLQASQRILGEEFRALALENKILKKTVEILERRLNDEQAAKESSQASAERNAEIHEDDTGAAD